MVGPPVAIVFYGEIDRGNIEALLSIVEQRYRDGARQFTLLLSTIGGSVVHGMGAYNFLKGLPIEVTTHNFGSVDSVGAVLYCAGRRRLAVPHARFVLHAPFFEFDEETLGERQLAERLAKLQVDARNMAAALADETGRSFDEVLRALRVRTVLDVAGGRDWGLVHEVRRDLVPEGAELVTVPQRPELSVEHLARAIAAGAAHREDELVLQAAGPEGSVATAAGAQSRS